MITTWYLTGDTHGQNDLRLKNIRRNTPKDITSENIGVIILGDSGYNFWLNKSDRKGKQYTCEMYVYCVRGNHEERPENLNYELQFDENVNGEVYMDPYNNKIRYFKDGGEYTIGGRSVLVVGGAYSVDKWYRLNRAKMAGLSFSGWFADEQLTGDEMARISEQVNGKHFDFVLTHTCPLSWEPTDLFLGGIDQSQVDKSMETWMDQLKDQIDWTVWCFGHFHSDRVQKRNVEMFYQDYDDIDNIWNRWSGDEPNLDWWVVKGPDYE